MHPAAAAVASTTWRWIIEQVEEVTGFMHLSLHDVTHKNTGQDGKRDIK